jgi:hypothetical protein
MPIVCDGWMRFRLSAMKPMAASFNLRILTTRRANGAQPTLQRLRVKG